MLRTLTIGTLVLVGMAGELHAQRRANPRDARSGPPHPEETVDWTAVEQRIAWFGTLEGGLAAAKQTGRPILLVSGAPQCQSVPGVW